MTKAFKLNCYVFSFAWHNTPLQLHKWMQCLNLLQIIFSFFTSSQVHQNCNITLASLSEITLHRSNYCVNVILIPISVVPKQATQISKHIYSPVLTQLNCQYTHSKYCLNVDNLMLLHVQFQYDLLKSTVWI